MRLYVRLISRSLIFQQYRDNTGFFIRVGGGGGQEIGVVCYSKCTKGAESETEILNIDFEHQCNYCESDITLYHFQLNQVLDGGGK